MNLKTLLLTLMLSISITSTVVASGLPYRFVENICWSKGDLMPFSIILSKDGKTAQATKEVSSYYEDSGCICDVYYNSSAFFNNELGVEGCYIVVF